MSSPTKTIVDVPGLPDPADEAAYVQCIRVGDWIRVAGQVGIDEEGETVSPDFEPQARQVFSNVETALEAAGSSLEDIIHQTVWLPDLRDVPEFTKIRRDVTGTALENRATSSVIGTDGLFSPEWLVEVEVTAIASDGDIEKEVIEVPELADPTAGFDRAYVQCVKAGDFVFLAGQIGVDDNYDPISLEFEPQVRHSYENIEHALRASGASMETMIDQTVWLTDMRRNDEFVELRGDIMGSRLSTSTLLETRGLAVPRLLVEVESLAVIGSSETEKQVQDIPGLPDPTTAQHETQDSSTRSYAQCVTAGDWVFLAGQIGVDEDYNVVANDFEAQVRKAFENIERSLNHVDADLTDMVHMRVFLPNMEYGPQFTSIRGDILGDARENLTTSTVVGQGLAWPDLLVEIEARAIIP